MGLVSKIELVEVAKKATSITIKDSTGAYNVSTNPGGYGTPNPDDPDTTALAYILWKYWTDTTYTKPLALNTTQITAILADGLAITPVLQGLSTDSDDVFADGIHQIKYLPAQDLHFTGTFTSGSKVVTLSGGSGIAALLANNGLVWAGVVDGPETRFYEVDTTGTNNNTTITLKTAAVSTVAGSVLVASEADLKVLVNKAAESCIASSTGKLGDIPGTCLDVEATLNKLIRWQFAAGIQYDCKDYDGAHNLVVSINKYCSSGKCICNL